MEKLTKEQLQKLTAKELKIRFIASQIRFLATGFKQLTFNWSTDPEFFFSEFENDYPFDCMPDEMEKKVKQWAETSINHLSDKFNINL